MEITRHFFIENKQFRRENYKQDGRKYYQETGKQESSVSEKSGKIATAVHIF